MLQQLRVVDLAHTMGITPRELIFKLRSIGVSVAGEEDTLDLSTVRAIITGETLQKRPREVIVRKEKPAEEGTSAGARERLARRRRRPVVKTEHEIREVAGERRAEDEEAGAMATADEAVAVAEMEAEGEVEIGDEQELELVAEELEPDEELETEEEPAEASEEAAATEDEEAASTAVREGVEEAEEAGEVEEVEETEAPTAEAEAVAEEPAHAPAEGEEEDEEEKPEVEITEEELTAAREEEESPRRVRRVRARTPLEQNLRELSPDEIKQRVKAQQTTEKKRKTAPSSRKAKAAADAREIRDLLNKFEEQKLKSQQEGTTGTGRPGPRPAPSRPGRKGRRRQPQESERRPVPQPTRTVQFKDGDKPEGPIVLSEMVTARELAEKLNVTAKDLLGMLIQRGVMVTTNQPLPHELAEEVCAELGVDAMVATAEEVIEFEQEESPEAAGPLEPRPPVVTVMGHVDHGKTSLLDALRSSRVAEQEAGGITQHIGASRITTEDGRTVVFVDTPGHEAFTHMRARGAQVTDLVILVVAADDGVMPQTQEAINHARAAGVPLIVALNKIDKANANPDRVKQQLAEAEVLVEDWGGDIPCVPVSAKKGDGIGDLLDMILLVSEMKDLKATRAGLARGVVLEARKERGRGIVATVIIQQGTLGVGDYFFCGSTWGRVRALTDDQGDRVDEAGPSDPVEIMGFDDVPSAGDVLQAVEGEERALEVSSFRSEREKEEGLASTRKVSLDNLFDRISEDETKELNIVVKADVQGSVEVLRETLTSLSSEKVRINVLHGSVGAVNTNDVMLASASDAIVIGFNVRPERTARELADTEQVDIRLYTVIYEVMDEMKKAMVGLLEPVFREEELGSAEVREVFRVPKVGTVAGCHVTDGVITRNAKARLLRDNVVVYTGQISSLKHHKDDAAEIRKGFDCGIGLDRYQDVKVGDVIEAYKMVEETPEL